MIKKKHIGTLLLVGSLLAGNVSASNLTLASDNTTVEVVATKYKDLRPIKKDRLFTSKIVESEIIRVKKLLTNSKLSWMFENCFPNTLDTTVRHRKTDGKDDTVVYTGDIHAMWLRDSGAQVWPYVQLANQDAELKAMLAGVARCQFMCINIDPYASAFLDPHDPNPDHQWMSDQTDMKLELHERKWEILTLSLRGGYTVKFRAYDDGVSYRFVTNLKGDVKVIGEDVNLNFPSEYLLHLQQPYGFKTAYEEPYTHIESKDWKSDDKMSTLPVLIDTKKEYKILISESYLSDYPCLFLQGNGKNSIVSKFPKQPLEFGEDEDRSQKLLKHADYIAKTSGKRSFPWRYFVVSKDDKKLMETTMTYNLATKNQIKDTSWIKPGQVSWEW